MQSAGETSEKNSGIKSKKKNRCVICRKKVGMLGFSCKCSNKDLFCSDHRYPDKHNCTYDYKKEYEEELIKQNPKIVPDKMTKI